MTDRHRTRSTNSNVNPGSVECRGGSRQRKWATASYFSTVGSIGLVSGVVGPTLGALSEQTGTALSTIGLVITARSLGYLLGALGSGVWIDRSMVHRFLAAILGVCALTLAIVPVTRTLWFLAGIMALLGWAMGGLDVAGNALVFRVYREQAGPYLNGLHFFFGVGGLIAPLFAAAVAAISGGIQWTYWGLALLPLPFAWILLRTPSPVPAQDVHTKSDRPKLSLPFLLASTFYLFYVGGQIGLVSWLYVYAERVASQQTATYIMGGFWAAFSLFRLLGVPISRRWSPARILTIDFVVVILAAVPMMIWPHALSALWMGSLGMGAAHASIYATGILLLGERESLAGRHMSTIVTMACAGSMVFPWLMGRLLDVIGPIAVPGLATALMTAAFAIAIWEGKRPLKRA